MITVGVDEVGRGCWAGPVVAGAVAFDDAAGLINGLTDSKLLPKAARTVLAASIYTQALAVGLGWVSAAEVDALGLTKAVGLAMRRAVEQIATKYDELIIDGNYNFLPDNPLAQTLVKADAIIPAVSAASIVAKVARDNWMATVAAAQFPAYGFESHVGYGTKLHREMLHLHGVCMLHRTTYKPVKALL